ncbi:hypothetical protein QBC44DRAFT_254214, partial [Cladorrhinum sp. PSN332]
ENAKGGYEASDKGARYGALSLFLCQTLSVHGIRRKHKDIHRHLCARFRESRVAQQPVLYGNGDQGFFGQVDTSCGMRSVCIIEREGSLQLLAGQAHGLCDGDRFTVSPGFTSDRDVEEGSIAVIRVGALTSQLEPLGTRTDIRTGWIAEPFACSHLTKLPIQLAPDLPQHDKLLAALNERSLGAGIDTDQAPALQVVLSQTNGYEILDGSGRKFINLPAMPQDQTDTGRICNVLEHLARYQMVKDLVNQTPTATFRTSFDIQMIRNGTVFGPGEQIETPHNSVVELGMKNLGDTVLYVHVYNLGSCWGVKTLLRATYEAIPQRKDRRNGDVPFTGWKKWRIKMTVPLSMREHGSCEDIIKIFVTSQPTSFGLLELPNLDELAETIAGARSSHQKSDVSEDWTALNFLIRVTYPSQESTAKSSLKESEGEEGKGGNERREQQPERVTPKKNSGAAQPTQSALEK